MGSQAILNAVGSFLLRILSMPATLLLLLFGEDLRWDASHPRDDLRVSLVEARAAERTLPRTEVEGQADAELVTLRGELTRRFSDDLTDSFR